MTAKIARRYFPTGRRLRTPPAVVTEFVDTFGRADAGSLGTSSGGGAWTEWNSSFTVTSGQAVQENESACGAFTPELSSSDQFAQATVASFTAGISSFIGPAVRAPATIGTLASNTGPFYMIVVSGASMNTFTIRSKDDLAGTTVTLVSVTQAIAAGDVLRLEAQGNVLRAYRNGVLVCSYTGAALTGQKRAGIYNDAGTGAVVAWDDFSAGTLTPQSAPVLFDDTFTRADAASLGVTPTGGTWTEYSNGFQIVSGRARQDNESTCSAFTPELSSSDQYAEARVASFTAGISSFIGPIVRAPATLGTSASTTGAHYALVVSGVGMDFFTIRQKDDLAGTTTILTSATAAIQPGDRLRLEAEANFLRAYLNGVLVCSYSAAALTSNKRAGIYNDAGVGAVVEWDDFSAGQIAVPTGAGVDPPLDAPSAGLIVTAAELAALPTTGTAYSSMLSIANSTWPTPNMSDQNNQCPAKAVAAALVYARTGNTSYKTKVETALAQLPDSVITIDSRALAWGRQLAGWCIAADLVGYRDSTFVSWVDSARTVTLPGHGRWTSIKVCALDSANNWGAWCLPSYLAASRYVGDTTGTQQGINILKGILGNGASYSAWRATADYDPTWVAGNPTAANFHGPGINPAAGGTGLDGGPAEDSGRSASAYPTMDDTGRDYCWEAVSGWMLAARLAKYAGFSDVYTYQSSALKRAGLFLSRFGGWPNGFAVNYPAAVALNRVYSTTIGALPPYGHGRQFGYTDWLPA